MTDIENNITVIGIGRLGLGFALLLEKAGYNVLGIDVNEAYVQEEKPKKAAAPTIVWFESRQPEPSMFDVAGLRSIRRYSDNHLEWKVMSDDVARFEKDHFIMNGRVRRKAVE